jgi:hypothetical protein
VAGCGWSWPIVYITNGLDDLRHYWLVRLSFPSRFHTSRVVGHDFAATDCPHQKTQLGGGPRRIGPFISELQALAFDSPHARARSEVGSTKTPLAPPCSCALGRGSPGGGGWEPATSGKYIRG